MAHKWRQCSPSLVVACSNVGSASRSVLNLSKLPSEQVRKNSELSAASVFVSSAAVAVARLFIIIIIIVVALLHNTDSVIVMMSLVAVNNMVIVCLLVLLYKINVTIFSALE